MRRVSDWRRVSRREPCPICGRADWCLIIGPEGDPHAAICPRMESRRRCGDAGWLHHLRRSAGPRGPVTVTIPWTTDAPDFAVAHQRAVARVDAAALEHFARQLGVAPAALQRLGVGRWARAWCFPMRDAAGRVIGLHLRADDGRKLSVCGSRMGLFTPDALAHDVTAHGRLLIAEGATDCAALLTLGLPAVGRPSCSGGVALLTALARALRPPAVVVTDADAPGVAGARRLAVALRLHVRDVRVIVPPAGVEDARDWVRRGATAVDIEAAAAAAPQTELPRIRWSVHKRKTSV